jgi:pimeloyl-ACP methyl ester carboxylesterase
VDWAKPDGAKFGLAVVRRKAVDAAQRVGSLLLDPGGPGGAGTDWVRTDAPSKLSANLLAHFDLIGFDPRGVGRSSPVLCDTTTRNEKYPAYPANAGEYQQMLAHNRKLGQSCQQLSTAVFGHIDNVSVARDIEAIRVALGEEKISYIGFSYGTMMGQQYAELFGAHLRAMVIDSNMDHTNTAESFLKSTAETLEGIFGQFADWCARITTCALHGQDVHALFDKLYAKAEKGKLTDPARPGRP